MVSYSHLFKNFPQFVVIHTVKVVSHSDKGGGFLCNKLDGESRAGALRHRKHHVEGAIRTLLQSLDPQATEL